MNKKADAALSAGKAKKGGQDVNRKEDFDLSSPQWYLNRELTWLEFNRRVLHEGQDDRTPLLERIMFMAIVGSNLDEFFMKRIGGLKQQVGAGVRKLTVDGRTPGEQIEECYEVVRDLLVQQEELEEVLLRRLSRRGIRIVRYQALDKEQKKEVNRYFHEYGVEWEIGLTHKYGDATEMARAAATSGNFDLVVGYGGDGTQHEVANGIMNTGMIMGVLPGGTGNGFGTELGIPHDLDAAVKLLCTSFKVREIDVAQFNDSTYFIQRLFTGIEPDEQTSRADKDKYGTFAYLIRDIKRYRSGEDKDLPHRLVVDGKDVEMRGHKVYVVNSGMAGTGIDIDRKDFRIDDGVLDVFMLSSDRKSEEAAVARFLGLQDEEAMMYYWRGKEIVIDAEPDQPVWTDGEYTGRTPVSIKILPKVLKVAVPEEI